MCIQAVSRPKRVRLFERVWGICVASAALFGPALPSVPGAEPKNAPGAAAASCQTSVPAVQGQVSDHEPYCGMRALYRGLTALGYSVQFADLLQPEYVQRDGSSAQQLEDAATKYGAFAVTVRGLTSASLESLSQPAILHVKREAGASTYNHWVLLMGFRGHDALIYDGVQPVRLVPAPEFAMLWDGIAVLLSPERISLASPYTAVFSQQLMIGLAAVLVIAVLRWIDFALLGRLAFFRRPRAVGVLLSAAAIVLFAGLAREAYSWTTGQDPWSYAELVGNVKRHGRVHFLPRVSRDEVRLAVQRGETTLVDARWKRDFEQGHLPKAINCEPNIRSDRCRELLAGASPSRPIIVYCQSRDCPYSKMIANQLLDVGYQNVTLYEGGWVDWQAAK